MRSNRSLVAALGLVHLRTISLAGLAVVMFTLVGPAQSRAEIVPDDVSDALRANYEDTLAHGRGNTIAKVGDSNTEGRQNLYALGCRTNLNLPSAESHLQDTANLYRQTKLPAAESFCDGSIANSFTHRSPATRGGGWSTLPLQASSRRAQAGGWFMRDRLCTSDAESSLACEIRLTNARYTIIGGGTNDFGWESLLTEEDLPASEEERFTKLIDATRANHSIPILQTIPAMRSSTGDANYNTEYATKVQEMNQAIRDAAEDRGAPLIDIWEATNTLPNYGLEWDGLHFRYPHGSNATQIVTNSGDLGTQGRALYGSNARNYYVLKTLNFLDSALSPDPPSDLNYDSLTIDEVEDDSVDLTVKVSGQVPAGADTVMTVSTDPSGSPLEEEISIAAGDNPITIDGLDDATNYYLRVVTTYSTPTGVKTVGSPGVSVTTEGEPQTTIKPLLPVQNPDGRTFDFETSVYGPGTTYQCRIDSGSWTDCKPPWTDPSISKGSHVFRVRAINEGTPDGPPGWPTLIPDATPAQQSFSVTTPNTRITAGDLWGGSIKNRNPSFTSASSEPSVQWGTTWILKKKGAADQWGFSGATQSFTNLADGEYQFVPNWQDPAGLWDPTPPVVNWTIDNVAPTTSITGGPAAGSKSNNRNPVFTFSSNEASAEFECRIWQGWADVPWGPCSSPKYYTGLPDNELWSFQVRAKDAAGNVGAPTNARSWTIDTVPPQVSVAGSPAQGVTTSSDTALFISSSTEPSVAATCTLKKNGVVLFNDFCDGTKSYSDLTPGNYEYTVNHADQAGNWDPTPPTRTWTIQ